MNSATVYATDRTGRRRVLGPDDVLADGESLRVGVLAMDSAPSHGSPQDAAEAAYQAMKAGMHFAPQAPAGVALSVAEADRIAAGAIAARQGAGTSHASDLAYRASCAILHTAGSR